MKTSVLMEALMIMVKREIKSQVAVQLKQVLKEQKIQLLSTQNKPMVTRSSINHQVRLDEALLMENQDMTSIEGILNATRVDMANNPSVGEQEDDYIDNTEFVKDYSAVLQKSYEKSGG